MKGYVDRFDSLIAGWVFDPLSPHAAIDIIVEHNGTELYRCSASIFREDLIPAIGSGEHGFGFEPEGLAGFDRNMRLQIFAISDKKHLLYENDWIYEGIVAEGTDQWLFLNRDTNLVNLRIAGQIGVEPDEIYKTAIQMASREALLSRMGIPYRALIVPEKNIVCAKNYPGLEISESRAVPLILEEARKFNCHPIYPISEFCSSSEELFYRTDTHANARGYNVIFNVLQRELPDLFGTAKLPTPYLNLEFCGDLGNKFSPVRTEVADEYKHPHTSDHFYDFDNINQTILEGGKLRGEIVSVINRTGTGRLLVFGTSSAYHSLPLVSCAFAQTIFVWENTFDYKIIDLFQPSCVLWFPSERFLPMQVDDLKGLPATLEKIQRII